MFLLRCAFWLSVVYASMYFGVPFRSLASGASAGVPAPSQPQGATAPGQSAQAGRAERAEQGTLAERLASQATAGLATLCAGREIDCLRDAAKLTALVQTAIAGAPDYETVAAPAPRTTPIPVLDPRRRGLLTR